MQKLILTLSLFFIFSYSFAQIPYIDNKNSVNEFLDQWHKDAAQANAEAYFGAMTENSVFLGTDPEERWSRDQFKAYAEDAFANKRTWNFKPEKRFISFNDEYTIAWFDEKLTTWMGPCRGSGVLEKISGEWKIRQYNLALTLKNELMTDYLKLIGEN